MIFCDRCGVEFAKDTNWGNCTKCGDDLCEKCAGGFNDLGECKKCVCKESAVKQENKITGIACSRPRYQYSGYYFEYSEYTGFCKLNKEGEPAKKQGDKFFQTMEKFLKLSVKQKRQYRVGGGCQRFSITR